MVNENILKIQEGIFKKSGMSFVIDDTKFLLKNEYGVRLFTLSGEFISKLISIGNDVFVFDKKINGEQYQMTINTNDLKIEKL